MLLLGAMVASAQSVKTHAPSSQPAGRVAAPNGTTDPPDDPGGGQPVTNPTYFEQNILVRSGETIEPLGPNLMGDQLNEFSGGLGFTQVDVSVPGNHALPVAVGRHLDVGTRLTVSGLFGDWDLEIPRLHTVALQQKPDWYGSSGYPSYNQNRCSQMALPPIGTYTANNKTLNLRPESYWDGFHLYVPGSGDQTMVSRAGGSTTNPIQPSDGAGYPVLTKQHWQFSCLATLEQGGGEGFLARAPDGSRYRFDHLVQRAYPGLDMKPYGMRPRVEIWILPTLVTDRFGNWVRYTYGGDGGSRVLSITSSDGRSITFAYAGWGDRIQSVNDGSRTWQYGYDGNGRLASVTLPDGSSWQFALGELERDPFASPDLGCYGLTGADNTTRSGTIVHPSGAVGQFGLRQTAHSRSNVPGSEAACDGSSYYANLVPLYFSNYALTTKTLSGPGMSAMSWSYSYSGSPGSFAPCNGCSSTKTVTISDPQGNVTQNTYGTQFGLTEGLLLASTQSPPNSSALQSTTFSYQAPNAGPYPSTVGYNAGYADSMSVVYTPQSQRTIGRQGVNFSQTATGFDVYAKPTGLTRSSTLGYSRTESTAYYDRTDLWVLGQVGSRTIAGVVARSTDFDGNTALPTASYRFGKLQGRYGFNADGTLASIADGLGQATSFGNYLRGLPQSIRYADGTTLGAVVNNIGTIASVTNEAGTTWSYGYDAIGRIASATPPGGDAVGYNPKLYAFVQVGTSEYGLEPGHWRQTITEGNAVTANYFDARWRKRLSVSYDAADPGNTQRMQSYAYDPYNRPTFAAYPARSIGSVGDAVAGTATIYDALGRPVQTVADSELGTLTTTTQYLGSFQKQVTDPRGYATVFAYQAFDEPSESAIVGIAAPEGQGTTIQRDVFGKPTSISRGGSAGGYNVGATRSYVYDGYQELCKTVEPETGATVQALDAASNLAWRATGLSLTDTSSCDWFSVPVASRVAFSYDARNRLTGTGFGDGSPSIGRAYTADGLPATAVSNGTTLAWGYNNRRLLVTENLTFPSNFTWTTSRGYDANAHLASLQYPDGSVVGYGPNALGEATQLSGYASGVRYHPNGAVAGYTLANGIVHTLTQNVRGLPLQNIDAGVLQDQYAYDAAGNITSIADQQEGISSRSMAYDGLDRLTAANAPGVWGGASYGYDALDNLRSSVVGGRSSSHAYDATNRLASITTNGSITGYAYDARGNVTGRGTTGYYFDLGNRMQLANGIASYVYDGLGRRAIKNGSDGSTMSSFYGQDGKLLITQNGTGYTLYAYLGGKVIGQTHSSTGRTFLHTDALGSPVATSNSSGGILSRTRYEPYGKTAAGTDPNGLGFTGHVNDPDSGLVYMQQRYYDPVAGRFLSVDPVVSDASTGAKFNVYEYGNSNPYRYTDPDGRDNIEDETHLGGRGEPVGVPRGMDGGPVRQSIENSRAELQRIVTARQLRQEGQSAFSKSRESALQDNNGVCNYCGTQSATQGDHVKPLKSFASEVNQGTMTKQEAIAESSSKSNVLGSCATCNGAKSANQLSATSGDGKFVPSNPSNAAKQKASSSSLEFQGTFRVDGRLDSARLAKDLK